MPWNIIADNKIRHIWEKNCDCDLDQNDGDEQDCSPDFYVENGEPSCEYCGTVFRYLRTEVLMDDEGDTCDCGHAFTASDIDGGRCHGCGVMILPNHLT